MDEGGNGPLRITVERPTDLGLLWMIERVRAGRISVGKGAELAKTLASVVTRDYSRRMIASVRGAKARLSELLDRAAAGEEIVIAAAGRPKAKLVKLGETTAPPFRVNRALLRGRPRKGARAERLVRAERDARD